MGNETFDLGLIMHARSHSRSVGARRPEQVDGMIAAAEFRLSGDEMDEIENTLANRRAETA
jgi:aryl-alcohol dehydrogenase-like predicted oxidoreductase